MGISSCSEAWLSTAHGFASAFLLFIYRSLFWNVNVLFDGPLWITFIGCLFTLICCLFRLRTSQFSVIRLLKQILSGTSADQSVSFKFALSFAFMIISNNLSLYYMDLPMYFIGRSLVVPINLILIYRRQSVKSFVGVLLGAILVVVGYIVTLTEENLINLLITEGILFGILASLFGTIFYQEASHLAPGNNYETHLNQVYLNNLVCCLVTSVAISFTEASEILFLPHSLHLVTLQFWSLVVVSCVISSILGTVVLREVATFSTSRRELIGVVRSLLQTVIAVLVFGVYTTPFWWVGVLLTAAGTALYWRAYVTNVTKGPTTNAGALSSLPLVSESAD